MLHQGGGNSATKSMSWAGGWHDFRVPRAAIPDTPCWVTVSTCVATCVTTWQGNCFENHSQNAFPVAEQMASETTRTRKPIFPKHFPSEINALPARIGEHQLKASTSARCTLCAPAHFIRSRTC